ncbi:MAG: hypothetical protein K6G88_10980 [Lachnospiraceae bacterium]|nr:hypothetical protein [Lachnospiraceae bacterium]
MAEFFSGRCDAETKRRFSDLFDEEELSFGDKINIMLDSYEELHKNHHPDPIGLKVSMNSMKRSFENSLLQLDEMERLYNTFANKLSDVANVSELKAENKAIKSENAKLRQECNSLKNELKKCEAEYKDAVRALISLEQKIK